MPFLLTFLTAFVVVPVVATLSRSLGWLDVPNHRSSHSAPTPRVGGVGVAAGLVVGVALSHGLTRTLWVPLIVAAALAAVGFVDDLRGLSARTRLLVQVAGAAIVTMWLWDVIAGYVLWPLILVLAMLWVVSVVNAFNFMDGINGIAGLHGSICLVAVALIQPHGDLGTLSLLVSSAVLGFLPWNVPRARTFLGDGGSYLIGFFCAALALAVALHVGQILVAPLLCLPFLMDTGATLVLRWRRGESLVSAHRSHFYQRLVQLGWTHSSVALVYAALEAVAAGSAVLLARVGWGWQSAAAISFAVAAQLSVPLIVYGARAR